MIAGGFFSVPAATNLAKWNGTNWVAVGTNSIFSSAPVDKTFVNGDFLFVSTGFFGGFQRWDGTNWTSIPGLTNNSSLNTMGGDGTNLYIGGHFTSVAGTSANNIAKWDGTNWTALGDGVTGEVYSILVHRGNVYAGGGFSTAGGASTRSIARWDGTNWHALGSGLAGSVITMAARNNEIYIGGGFTTAGGRPNSGLAMYNLNPTVKTFANGNEVSLSWTTDTTKWTAQSSPDFSPNSWTDMQQATFATNVYTVTTNLSSGRRFFRLIQR